MPAGGQTWLTRTPGEEFCTSGLHTIGFQKKYKNIKIYIKKKDSVKTACNVKLSEVARNPEEKEIKLV